MEEIVFRWSSESCTAGVVAPDGCVEGYGDLPDGPARAFVDATGQVQVILPNDNAYRGVGDNLDTTLHDCGGPVLGSARDPTPRNYADFEWLFSPYTLDGTTIYGLVHNEYHGWCHSTCPYSPGTFDPRCTWASITQVVSTDAGATYRHARAPPGHLVASSPDDYAPTATDPAMLAFPGYREPSNILRGPDGGLYALIQLATAKPISGVFQRNCLIRTDDAGLADPRAWRAYDGSGFNQPLDRLLCEPLPVGGMQWSYNTYLRRYLVVGFALDGFGVFQSATSDDLLRWEPQVPLLTTRLPWQAGTGTWRSYPSLLQPGDPTDNFEQTGRSPWLYFVNQTPPMGGLDRNVSRRRVRFTLPGDEGRYDRLSLSMNERRGLQTLDSSFYGNNGGLEGSVTWSTNSAVGKTALVFPGTPDARVRVDPSSSLDITGSLTIEAFVRIDRLSADPAGFARILRKAGGTPGTTNFSLTVPPASNPCAGRIFFAFSSAGVPIGACGSRRIDDGRWHHVAAAFDVNTQGLITYVDGLKDTTSVLAGVPADGVNTAPAILGSYLEGALDGVRLFDYFRTPAEIAEASRGSGSAELCNGFDDDGDGLTDEEYSCARDSVEASLCASGSGTQVRSCDSRCVWGAFSACAGEQDGGQGDAGDDAGSGDAARPDAGPNDAGSSDAGARGSARGCGCGTGGRRLRARSVLGWCVLILIAYGGRRRGASVVARFRAR